MKTTIISSCICLVIGITIGVGSYYFYQKKQSNNIVNNTQIEVITGEPGTIEHENIQNKPDHIEITTVSTGKGKVKTKIKKSAICPKHKKNSLSAIVYGGIQDLQPVISYGIEYRRQLLRSVHILTGIKIDTNVYMVNGFQVFIGAGVNF